MDRDFTHLPLLSQAHIREAARQQRQRAYELNLTLYHLSGNGKVAPVSARVLYTPVGNER